MATRLYQDVELESASRPRPTSRPPTPGSRARWVVVALLALIVIVPAIASRADAGPAKGHERRMEKGTDKGDAEVLGEIIVQPPVATPTDAGVDMADVILTSLALGLSGAATYTCARSLWESRTSKKSHSAHDVATAQANR